MARFNPIKNSFVAGEISPRLEGRDDIDQYFQGLRQTKNGVVLPHGGFMRRSGTRFVAEVKDSSKKVRLIPFVVSEVAAYVLELGDEYMRFFVNSGRLESGSPSSPVEISTPWGEDDLADIQYAQSANFLYLVHPNYTPRRLERTSPTSFSLTEVEWDQGKAPVRTTNLDLGNELDITGSGPYTLTWDQNPISGGLSSADVGRAVRLVDPDDADNIVWFEITGVTDGKTASASWENSEESTIPTNKGSEWNLGQFAPADGCRAVAFHEGRLCFGGFVSEPAKVALSDSDAFQRFTIADAAADLSIYRTLVGEGSANQVQWMVSANEQLVIGTTGSEFVLRGENLDKLTPEGARVVLVASRGGRNIQPVVIDNQATYVQRNGTKLRNFQFQLQQDSLVPRDLSILAEHILRISPALRLSYQQDPNSVVWVQRENGELAGWTLENEQQIIAAHRHEFGGSFLGGRARVETLATIPASGFSQDQTWFVVKRTIDGSTKQYIEYFAPQFNPGVEPGSPNEELVRGVENAFFVDCGLTLDNPIIITDVEIQEFSGNDLIVFQTDGPHGLDSLVDTVRFRDFVGIEGLNFRSILVTRTNTATQFAIEVEKGAVSGEFLGFGKAYKEITTLSGLDHLAGETVDILADGATHPQKVVDEEGSITLDRKSSIVHVGLPFIFEGETQRFVAQLNVGTSQGQKARIQRASLRLHNTVGLLVGQGPAPDRLERILFSSGSRPMSLANPLFSGDKEVPIPGGWTTEPTIFFRQDQPLPATILAIMPRMEANER